MIIGVRVLLNVREVYGTAYVGKSGHNKLAGVDLMKGVSGPSESRRLFIIILRARA